MKSPGLTGTIVLTVGLGIGGCATIFSMVDALYLRPLPYPDASRLAWIYTDAPPNHFPFSVVDFQALREGQTSFASIAATRGAGRAITTGDGVSSSGWWRAHPGLSDVGIVGGRGRTPTEAEGAPGAPGTALVTPGFVQRYLGAMDPATALGKVVTLDDEPYEIIGILPASIGPLARGVGILPTRREPPTRKGPFFLQVYGRLRPGTDPAARSASCAR